jgi:hypothetical protein
MEPTISYTKLYTRIRLSDTVHCYAGAVLELGLLIKKATNEVEIDSRE